MRDERKVRLENDHSTVLHLEHISGEKREQIRKVRRKMAQDLVGRDDAAWWIAMICTESGQLIISAHGTGRAADDSGPVLETMNEMLQSLEKMREQIVCDMARVRERRDEKAEGANDANG